MLIVSQDKNEIVNVDNIQGIKIINNTVLRVLFVTGLEDDYTDIGAYKTEERAKEVLEEITFAYANMEMLKIPKIDIRQVIPAIEMVRNICYKMPKE